MTIDVGVFVVIALLYSAGAYLLLERSIMRMLFGLLLMGNATNLLLLQSGGNGGSPPVVGARSEASSDMADPLAQAMILTAIVITMGVAAFVVTLAYRAFTLSNADDIEDDPEDTKVSRRTDAEAPDRDRPGSDRDDESDVTDRPPVPDRAEGAP